MEKKAMKRPLGILLLLAETKGAGCAAFVSYLLCVWMESDTFAVHASDQDWWIEGGKRFLIVVLGALVAATVLRWVNRHLFPLVGLQTGRTEWYSAAALFVLMAVAGAAGAIEFVTARPFL